MQALFNDWVQIREEEFKMQAKAGTPRGEGAKLVARLAFQRIRELQSAVAEGRQCIDAKTASAATLEQTIAGLEAAARQRDVAVSEAEDKLARVRLGCAWPVLYEAGFQKGCWLSKRLQLCLSCSCCCVAGRS
jgi:uncharacterized coiled-coil protein SlyX